MNFCSDDVLEPACIRLANHILVGRLLPATEVMTYNPFEPDDKGRYASRITTLGRFAKSVAAGFWRCAAGRVRASRGARPRVIGNLQRTPDELANIKQNDCNEVHLIARQHDHANLQWRRHMHRN